MPDEKTTQTEAKCPYHHANGVGKSNRDWWPEQLNLGILHQHSSLSNPMGEEFNYAEEFKSLDLDAFPIPFGSLHRQKEEGDNDKQPR